jgi:outer membrane protein assembly factor BamB
VTRARLIWIVGGAAALALAGAGAGLLAWDWYNERPESVRGTSTIEFVPREPPQVERPPARVKLDEPWTTYAYDHARTHLSSFPHRPPYRRVWMVRTGSYIEFPPAVAYGRVFVAQLRGRFFAIDAETGRVIWRKRFRACTAASPTVSNGVVYQPYLPLPCDYGSRAKRGFIVAMKVQGGRQLWRFPVSSEASLLLRGGVLYFGAWDHRVYALRVRDRKVLWRFEADDELNSSPAYAAGTIYIGSNGGSLYALDIRTGRLRWRARSFASRRWGREYFYATPTVAYGRVFIGNSDGIVYAFGATTGRLLWARRIGNYVYSAAAVWRKTVYVGSYDGGLYALDAATGDVKWRFEAASTVHGAPTVNNGVVYFSSCGTCGHRNSRPVKLGARRTYALDARTGKLLWSFPDGRYSPVVADSERLYLVGDTRVYGLVPRRARAAS